MNGLLRDVRFGLRRLYQKPRLCDGRRYSRSRLATGASTIIFSIVLYNGVLYPFRLSQCEERLTAVMVVDAEDKGNRGMFPLSDVRALRGGRPRTGTSWPMACGT